MFNIIPCDEAVAEQEYVRTIVDVEQMTTDFTILFSKENMLEAAKEVAKKKSAGIDGISAKEARTYIEEHYPEIYNHLLNGDYRPDKVLLKHIPKEGNLSKTRPIAVATVVDRIIQKVISSAIMQTLDEDMSEHSYGFRKKLNCYMAVKRVVEYCEQGYRIIIKLDLSNCFNHLNQDMILYKVRQKIDDENLIKLINRYLKVTYIEKGSKIKNFSGSAQGSSLSPLYANMILDDLDKELSRRGHAFIRYADDTCILCKSEKAAKRILKSTTRYIERRCKLVVNQEKSKICSIEDGVDILGFHLYKTMDVIHIVPKQKNVDRFKEKIKTICNSETGQEVVNDLNPIIKGWINYYADTEISRTSRKLDLFIKKQLDKTEKRTGIRIDRTKLCSCHEVYKGGRHSEQKVTRRCMLSDLNGAAANPDLTEDKTAVSSKGRSPPQSFYK